MAESLKINKLVSPSWSWLKINEAEIDFDFSLENIFPEIKNGQNFISYENCGGLKKDFPELLSGTGKSSDSIFENSVPMEISIPENVKIEEPIVLNYDF